MTGLYREKFFSPTFVSRCNGTVCTSSLLHSFTLEKSSDQLIHFDRGEKEALTAYGGLATVPGGIDILCVLPLYEQ